MNKTRWTYRLLGMAISITLAVPVSADISLSQVPLSLVSGADPNVMILFDNSSSMVSDLVGYNFEDVSGPPDSYSTGLGLAILTFSPLDGTSGDFPVRPDDEGPCMQEFSIRKRSSVYNTLYYNPATLYKPWAGPSQNGSSTEYPNATPSNTRLFFGFSDPAAVNVLDDSDYYLYQTNGTVTIITPAPGSGAPNLVSTDATIGQCTSLLLSHIENGTAAYYSAEENPGNANEYLYSFTFAADSFPSYPYIAYYFPQTSTQGGYIRVIIKGIDNPTLYLKYPGQPETIASAANLQQAFSSNGITRTISSLNDEIQNFANWLQYYRLRINAMRSALSNSLIELPTNMRIGIQFLDSWTDSSTRLNSTASDTTASLSAYTTAGGQPLPLRQFSDNNRTRVFDVLFNRPFVASNIEQTYETPLREAFDDIGQYLTSPSNAGPWSGTPGTAVTERQASCRRNYTVITTDGYYGYYTNVIPSSRSMDWDTTVAGTTVTGKNNQTCTFNGNDSDDCNANRTRFHDPSTSTTSCQRTGTLSDLAMYYWETDLRPTTAGNGATCNTGTTPDATRDMCNDLLTTSSDPAFWQHMVTHAIGFGTAGTFDPAYPPASPGPELWGTSCPILASGGNNSNPGAADDLFHAAVNGHGRYISALSPSQIQEGMKAILSEILAASRSANPSRSFSATRTSDNPLLFLTNFDAGDWSGNIQAFTASTYLDGSNTITPVWSALARMPTPAQRYIHTVTPPTDGVTPNDGNIAATATAFTDGALGTTAKSLLQRCAPKTSGTTDTNLISCNTDANANPSPAVTNANLIAYLRGDATLETGTNALRTRVRAEATRAPLGDIVNSAPAYVAQSFFPYRDDPTYATFSTKTALRTRMLYVGSNDGMLHAFRATDSDSGNDAGKELFAYVPWSVMNNMGRLPRTDYIENHRFFVDGPIYVGDAKIGTTGDEWKSILVGVLGAGGQAVYALDVTGDIPDVSSTWYQTPANVVKWEFTHPQLGNVFGQPTILKMKYGTTSPTIKWVVAVGNGYNSNGDDARLVLIDISTGALLNSQTVYQGGLGANGNSSKPNGLAPPVPVDLNGDGVTDYLYAGDLKGNLLRYDVRDVSNIHIERVFRAGRSETNNTSDNDTDDPEDDSNDNGNGNNNGNGNGNNNNNNNGNANGSAPRRPITGRPAVARLSDLTGGTDAGVVIFFGTGRYFATDDQTDNWDQGFYAVLDRYSTSTTTVNGVRAMTSHNPPLDRGDLVKKTILGPFTVASSGYIARVVDPSKDAGGTVRTDDYIWGTGTTDSGKRGWYMTLPDTGERSVSTPVFQRSLGRILFGTLVPAQSANSCNASATGWFMVLNGATGGSPATACGDTGVNQDLACTINLGTEQGEFTNADTVQVGGNSYSAAGVKIQDPGIVAEGGGVNSDESRLTGNCVAGPDGCVSVEIKEKKLQGKQTSWRQLNE